MSYKDYAHNALVRLCLYLAQAPFLNSDGQLHFRLQGSDTDQMLVF